MAFISQHSETTNSIANILPCLYDVQKVQGIIRKDFVKIGRSILMLILVHTDFCPVGLENTDRFLYGRVRAPLCQKNWCSVYDIKLHLMVRLQL